eukprot:6155315-Amphidinium_carterae.1
MVVLRPEPFITRNTTTQQHARRFPVKGLHSLMPGVDSGNACYSVLGQLFYARCSEIPRSCPTQGFQCKAQAFRYAFSYSLN